ncbi:MAG: four helix bundle protein [Patescibacteria group bacterium]
MPNEAQNPKSQKYDLADRTIRFAEQIVAFCTTVPKNPVTMPLISQLVRSGTSVGANYAEADGASSKKDFNNKISICRKEAKETKYWLTVISKAVSDKEEAATYLLKEAQEFILIFSAILR